VQNFKLCIEEADYSQEIHALVEILHKSGL